VVGRLRTSFRSPQPSISRGRVQSPFGEPGPQTSNLLAYGSSTALLGLFCHFFIAFSAATVYLTASLWVPFLLEHAVISGAFYGVAVYFFMNRAVVPLSGAIKYPFSLQMMVIGVAIHIFYIGLPIALVVKRYSMQWK